MTNIISGIQMQSMQTCQLGTYLKSSPTSMFVSVSLSSYCGVNIDEYSIKRLLFHFAVNEIRL